MAGTDLAQLLLKHGVTVLLLLCLLRLLAHASAARRVFAARCGLVALLLMPLFWLSLPPMPRRQSTPPPGAPRWQGCTARWGCAAK